LSEALAVAVGVGEVDRDGAAVVCGVVDRVVVLEQPPHGAAELAPVGIQERHVVEAGVAGRRRRGARALPRVQADVVVVVARREEHRVQADLTRVGGHAEAERVAIERERAVQVGDAQVHVPDAHRGMDGFVMHAAQSPAGRARGHR
jgi:hypothetical protein